MFPTNNLLTNHTHTHTYTHKYIYIHTHIYIYIYIYYFAEQIKHIMKKLLSNKMNKATHHPINKQLSNFLLQPNALQLWIMNIKKMLIQRNVYIYIFFLTRGINIVNWITTTRKSAEHLRTIYGNTEQLFRPYWISSGVYTVIWIFWSW